MFDDIHNINVVEVKKELIKGIIESNKRGLTKTTKFLTELNYGLKSVHIPNNKLNLYKDLVNKELNNYNLAKIYLDLQEYDRSSYFTENCEKNINKFLNLQCIIKAIVKKYKDNITDNNNENLIKNEYIKKLSELVNVFKKMHNERSLDGYTLYLYGKVLKKIKLNDLAVNILLESIHLLPINWDAWHELVSLIKDKDILLTTNLPKHWMKYFFIGYAYIELNLNDDGIKIFNELSSSGFKKCNFVITQTALAYSNKREVDKAIELFQELQEVDPYRIDNLDTYSNLLFVKELKTDITYLAHKVININKYRPETCCIIGNYYSIRSEHQTAVIYFQRAIRLNNKYLSAWTLMGHEFMEMKNTNAAIQSYRQAVEVNSKDFRAWYGLGQAYEILKMPFYSLYYYKIAQKLRPYDSRMLVALGEIYEKLNKYNNSLKCYNKANNVGDIEDIAILKLANLYEKLGDIENAVPAYLDYCANEKIIIDKLSLSHAYIILGNYYESIGNLDEASHFAYKCLEYDETKTEAKALLKTIANTRAINLKQQHDDQEAQDNDTQQQSNKLSQSAKCEGMVVEEIIVDNPVIDANNEFFMDSV